MYEKPKVTIDLEEYNDLINESSTTIKALQLIAGNLAWYADGVRNLYPQERNSKEWLDVQQLLQQEIQYKTTNRFIGFDFQGKPRNERKLVIR